MATNFELVKLALDEAYKVVEKVSGSKVKEALDAGFANLRYENLLDPRRPPVDYSSAATRFAYVYTYVAAHGSWVSELLLNTGELCELIQKSRYLSATCLGGGPGSELVGLLSACNTLGRRDPVFCFLIDKEDGWSEAWTDIGRNVRSTCPLSTSLRAVDIFNPPKPENLAKAYDADVFFAVYFLSEICAFRDRAAAFFRQLTDVMKSGAFVVYLDNKSKEFTEYAESIFDANRFTRIGGWDERSLRLDASEDRKALGRYLEMVGRPPRLTAESAARIWRKK
jgi:hypothetical protein